MLAIENDSRFIMIQTSALTLAATERRCDHEMRACYLAALASISAQACATAELGSLLPGNVAQPPWLT